MRVNITASKKESIYVTSFMILNSEECMETDWRAAGWPRKVRYCVTSFSAIICYSLINCHHVSGSLDDYTGPPALLPVASLVPYPLVLTFRLGCSKCSLVLICTVKLDCQEEYQQIGDNPTAGRMWSCHYSSSLIEDCGLLFRDCFLIVTADCFNFYI